MKSTGLLYAFSKVHIAPPHYRSPYVIGYVDLDEGPRAFGQIQHPADELRIGHRVEATIAVTRFGPDEISMPGYVFKRASAAYG